MRRKRYRSIPRAPSRPLLRAYDWDGEEVVIPDPIVYDLEPSTVKTGILDARGDEIVYDIPAMDPIGFVHFPDPQEDEE